MGQLFGIGFGFLIVFVISAIIGAFTWPYTINTWLVFLDKTPVLVWWHGVILGFIPWFGQISILAAATTWILMLFLI